MSDLPKIEFVLHKRESFWKSKTHGMEIHQNTNFSMRKSFRLTFNGGSEGCYFATLNEARETAPRVAQEYKIKP